MSNLKRHVGKLKNTDQRCVVVFMQIPNRPTHALVIPTDGLPPRFEQAIMDVLESPEGQAEPVFANVLHRRFMPDTRQTILQSLHDFGAMNAVPVDNVVMFPAPNMPFPLRQVIEQMGGTVPGANPAAPDGMQDKYNPHVHAQRNDVAEGVRGVAQNLIIEANMLESDARVLMNTANQSGSKPTRPILRFVRNR